MIIILIANNDRVFECFLRVYCSRDIIYTATRKREREG